MVTAAPGIPVPALSVGVQGRQDCVSCWWEELCHAEDRGDVRFTPLWPVTSDTDMARVALQACLHGCLHGFPPSSAGDLQDVGARGCGGTLAAMSASAGARGPAGPWCHAGWVNTKLGKLTCLLF